MTSTEVCEEETRWETPLPYVDIRPESNLPVYSKRNPRIERILSIIGSRNEDLKREFVEIRNTLRTIEGKLKRMGDIDKQAELVLWYSPKINEESRKELQEVIMVINAGARRLLEIGDEGTAS